MKRRFLLTLFSLGIALFVYFLYAAIIVPNAIFPPALMREVGKNHIVGPQAEITETLNRYRELLAPLFPESNDWRRQSPRLFFAADESLFFLFKGEPTWSANRKEFSINSCTIVLPKERESGLSEEDRFRLAIVIETHERMTIFLKSPLSISRAPTLGDCDKVKLTGEVNIRSNDTYDEFGTGFSLTTRDISFTSEQILANNEIQFRIGNLNILGEQLQIDLEKNAQPKSDAQGFLGTYKGNVGGNYSIKWITLTKLKMFQFDTDTNFLNLTPKGEAPEDVQIELSCKNGFRFEPNLNKPTEWIGSFFDNVQVSMIYDTEKPDRLACKNLRIFLSDREMEAGLQEMKDNNLPLPDRLPSGRLSKLEPYMVAVDRSESEQAELEVPRRELIGWADHLFYDFVKERLVLIAMDQSEPVRFQYEDTKIESERIDYSGIENQKLGKLLIQGKGNLAASIPNANDRAAAQQRVYLSWENGLRAEPDSANRDLLKIDVAGNVNFETDSGEKVSSQEAHFFGLLHDKDASSLGASQNNGAIPLDITPQRLIFMGNIQLASTTGNCSVRKVMSILFQEGEVFSSNEPAKATTTPVAGPEKGKESSSLFDLGLGSNDPKKSSQYQLDCGSMDLLVLYDQNKKAQVAELNLRENIQLTQTEGGTEAMNISGNEAKLKNLNTDRDQIQLVGRPAVFRQKETVVEGYDIRVDRARNEIAVLGRGNFSTLVRGNLRATMQNNPPALQPSSTATTPRKLDVYWSGGMNFNGQTLSIVGSEESPVLVQQKPVLELLSPEILFTTQRRINIFEFDKISPDESLLASVTCRGSNTSPVEFFYDGSQDRSVAGAESPAAENAQTGTYRGKVSDITYRFSDGEILANGPGWLRGTAHSVEGKSVKIPGASKGDETVFGTDPWIHFHTTFSKGLKGLALEGKPATATLYGNVTTVVAESAERQLTLNSEDKRTFPAKSFFMSSDSVTINQSPTVLATNNLPLELTASGNALFRHAIYTVRGEQLKYSDEKKTVTIEGDGLNPASISRQTAPGMPYQSNTFARGMYNLETQKFEGNIQNTSFDQIPDISL